jgi:hypothetical protein
MAADVGRESEYTLLYSSYSAVTHGKDAARVVSEFGGSKCFTPMRSVESASEVYDLTRVFLMQATQFIARQLGSADKTRADLKRIILRHRKDSAKR